jgi:hypothetical protein
MRKLVVFLAVLLFSGVSASAQSFFKPIPKVQPNYTIFPSHGVYRGAAPTIYTIKADSTFNTFRPVANIASYGLPGNILLTGAGVSYQHLKYDISTQKWNCIWSVNAMGWLTATPDPTQPNPNLASYGIAAGFFNNLILVGVAANDNKFFATLGIGVSLNN